MWVQSQEGGGSTFGFSIRVRVEEDAIAHQCIDAGSLGDVVEDDGGGQTHGDASARWPPSSASTSAAALELMSPPRYHRKVYRWRPRSFAPSISPTLATLSSASDVELPLPNASLYQPKTLSPTRCTSSPLRLLLAEDTCSLHSSRWCPCTGRDGREAGDQQSQEPDR